MAKKAAPIYAICGQCGEDIDMPKLQAAMRADRTYIHYCGRVLHWGDGNAEVLPRSDVESNPSNSSESNG